MGKRITLSRPRMLGSFADESVERVALFESPLRVVDAGVFFPDGLPITVDDDDVVTCVVVETVSTRGGAPCADVDEAAEVSAADSAGLQPVAIASAANPLTRSSLVIGRFLEWLEVQWVFAASLSPRHPP
jgi:hypothetical protein